MANFRPIDRDTGFLMPPSVNEWLPAQHLVLGQCQHGLHARGSSAGGPASSGLVSRLVSGGPASGVRWTTRLPLPPNRAIGPP